jgi:hypothetical protein
VDTRFRAALAVVILMWAALTWLFAQYLPQPLAALEALLPGLIAVGALLSAGLTLDDCYLRAGAISRRGLAALVAVLPIGVIVSLSGTQTGWVGWRWLPVLVYAPLDAVSQELFFRAALLPALDTAYPGRPRLALVTHAVFFALYHVGMFKTAPLGVALAAMLLTFLAGLGWGWQTRHDRTVVWAMGEHALFLMANALFAWA